MSSTSRITRSALLGLGAFLFACADSPTGLRTAHVIVRLMTPATVASVTVEVSGPGISPAVIVNIPVGADSVAWDTLTVTAGSGRRFVVTAVDTAGVQTHRADTTITLLSGTNAPLAIRLDPLASTLGITVTFGGVTLTVSDTATRVMAVGDTLRVTASALTPAGETVPADSLVWGSSNPALFTVEGGLLRGVRSGVGTLVVSYRGAAVRIRLVVAGAASPTELVAMIPGLLFKDVIASGDTAYFALAELSSATTIAGVLHTPGGSGSVADKMIVKLDPGLVPRWAVQIEDVSGQMNLAVDDVGRVYLNGGIEGDAGVAAITVRHTGGATVITTGGKADGAVVALDANGVLVRTLRLTAGSNEGIWSVSASSNGSVVAGNFNGCCPTGSTLLEPPTGGSVALAPIGFATGLVARLDATGAYLWNSRVGERDAAFVGAVISASNNRVFALAGIRFSGTTATLADGLGAAQGLPKACGFETCSYLVALDATTGAYLWHVGSSHDHSGAPASIVLSGDRPAWIVRLSDGASFAPPGGGAPTTIPAGPGADHRYVLRFDGTGAVESSANFSSTNSLDVGSITGQSNGTLLVPLGFAGQLTLPSGSLSATGAQDGALLSISPTAVTTVLLTLTEVSGASGAIRGASVSSNGTLVAVGVASAGSTLGSTLIPSTGGFLYRRTP